MKPFDADDPDAGTHLDVRPPAKNFLFPNKSSRAGGYSEG